MAQARKKDDLRQQEEIFGILLMTLALLVLISLVSYDPSEEPPGLGPSPVQNAMGIVGVYISYFLIKLFIGYSSVVIPFLLFAWGWNRFRGNDPKRLGRITLFVMATALYVATIMGLPQAADPENTRFGFEFSGLVGGFFASKLYQFFGTIGSIIILISLAMITVVAVTQFSFARIVAELIHGVRVTFGWLQKQFGKIHLPRFSLPRRKSRMGRRTRHMPTGLDTSPPKKPPRVPDVPTEKPAPPKGSAELRDSQPVNTGSAAAPPPADLFSAIPIEASVPKAENHRGPDPGIKVTEMEEEKPAGESVARPAAIGAYQFPSLDLLDYPDAQKPPVSKEELLANAKILEERLEEFGVEGNVVEINPGPVITRYEYEPAPGVKVSKITSLADDLALAMRAKRIRIVAPIPGKAAVGVELPNRNPQVVFLRSIIDTEEFQKSPSPLTLALGKTISGKPYVTQLDQMPHLLVAGSTGSGKSVCLNTIVASILFKAHPTQVKFVLIDPKRLELSIYKKLIHHHLIYREDLDEVVVTNPQNALAVLKSLVYEMEQRYDRLAEAGVRNIDDYNQRLKEGRIKHEDEDEPLLPLPRIVVIIDELADLMLMAAKEVEEPIARLTQMARAVGIHLIVATQRPSVDVITGVIKANFPSRIAFAVASKTDSRTILDMNGAEKLLGRGDMLFLPSGSPEPIRLHGAYISTDEIERILDHIQQQPRYPRKLLPVREEAFAGGLDGFGTGGKRDALFKEALKLVVRHQQGSISLLQRRLKIGYARAARLIDELEAAGIVGGFDGSKAREVLITEEELEHMDLDAL